MVKIDDIIEMIEYKKMNGWVRVRVIPLLLFR